MDAAHVTVSRTIPCGTDSRPSRKANVVSSSGLLFGTLRDVLDEGDRSVVGWAGREETEWMTGRFQPLRSWPSID